MATYGIILGNPSYNGSNGFVFDATVYDQFGNSFLVSNAANYSFGDTEIMSKALGAAVSGWNAQSPQPSGFAPISIGSDTVNVLGLVASNSQVEFK